MILHIICAADRIVRSIHVKDEYIILRQCISIRRLSLLQIILTPRQLGQFNLAFRISPVGADLIDHILTGYIV